MSKLRKQFITVLAVLMCAMLALSATLIIPKNKTAEAYGPSTKPTSADVGELYNGADAQNTFNSNNLKTLYQKLTDNSNATLSNVASLASANTTITSNIGKFPTTTSVTVAGTPVANKNIIVEFGGLLWTAVFVSKAEKDLGGTTSDPTKAGYAADGDVVLTLWLANPTETSHWNTNHSDIIGTYPSDMYGISYMRSVVLNNGGQYWTSSTTLSGATSPVDNNPYGFSKFTSDYYYSNRTGGTRIPSTIKDYLVSPRYIGWQYQQQAAELGSVDGHSILTPLGRNFNNDAWGSVGNSLFTCINTYNNRNNPETQTICYEGYDKYDAWKDDILWLPSVTEVGWGSSNIPIDGSVVSGSLSDHPGLWQTTYDQRRYADGNEYADMNPDTVTWLRSGFCNEGGCVYRIFVAGLNSVRWECDNISNRGNWVRPALHLNLTKAEKAVAFGTSTNPSFEDSEDNNIKTVKIEHVYDNQAAEIAVRDYLNLDFTGDTAQFNSSNGKFSATLPNTDKDRIYTLKAKPKTGFYWSDTLSNEERKYEIVIKALDVNVNWSELNVAYGASLLGQSMNGVTSPNLPSSIAFNPSVEYIVVKPNDAFDANSPPSENDTNWKSTQVPNSTATEMGTYHVWYKITANYHNVKIGYYEVKVSRDTLTVTVADEAAVSGDYAQYDTTFNPNDAGWLKGKFADKVKIETGSNTYATPSAVLNFLTSQSLEVVLLNEDGSDPTLNGYTRHDAGTYILGLKDASGSYGVNWTDNKHPKIEINKLSVRVKLIAKQGGDLKSTYGDEPVALEYSIISGLLADEQLSDINPRYDSFKIEDGTALSKTTPVGTHQVKGATWDSNYDVTFDRTDYIVDPRPITLKIADKQAEYGTDFTDYRFDMDITSGSLVGNDNLDTLTANAEFKITLNGMDSDKSNLFIGVYDVSATVPNGNYIFTVGGGKLTITKANYDMSGVTFVNKGYVYDGNPHPAQYSGTLPSDEITVSYRYINTADGSESTDAPVEVGLYLVYASFTHSNGNYNAIDDKVAYIRIAATAEEANQPFPNLPTDEEIQAAADLAKKKDEAKKTLDEEAKKKKDEIDADVNLTPEEKKAAKDEIDEELKKGNEAIDKAKDKDSVDKAYDDGKKEIEDTAELVEKKGAAKSELDKAAQAKKDAIDANPELTDEEKQAAKDKVDEELAKGKAEIDGATNVSGVQSVESTTKTNIENIKPEHSGSFPWWILAVIAGAVVLLTVLIIVIVKRRNAEDDDDGYDDFYDDEYDYDEEEESDDGDEAYSY